MEMNFSQQASKVIQLAETLSQAISLGEFKIGDMLPSINHISNQYQVSRDTVFKAFLNLRDRGLIDSVPGKGYYVTNQHYNILLLLDEFSPFKEDLYNSFTRRLPKDYRVDLIFHQYNERLFNTIIRDALGRYNKYVVMNFDNEKVAKGLDAIDRSKLLLLDFGKFDKSGYAYICQDFDESFYQGLEALLDAFRKYQRIELVFSKGLKHPQSCKQFFEKFCVDYAFPHAIVDDMESRPLEKGTAYVIIRQQQVVSVIKKGRAQGLQCGKDYGILGYNDYPAYEVMDVGITSLSIDFEKMGAMAAQFVLLPNLMCHEYLPTEVHLRHSL